MDGKIKEIMADVFEVAEDDIGDDTTALDLPSWDSMNHMRFVTALEQVFEIRLTMDEVRFINSFQRAREIVRSHLRSAASSSEEDDSGRVSLNH